VVTAAGNNFTGQQGEGFTAIIPGSLSVTATDASDNLISDAQRLGSAVGGASATVIAAPGDNLWAPVDGNNFQSVEGTSFATGIVTGSVDLLQQIYENRFGTLPTIAQLEGWMQQGAVTVNDPVTGISIGRLSISGAAALIPTPAPVVVVAPTPTPTPTPTPSTTAYFFNGQAAGTFTADNSNSGWTSFFTIFSGNLNTLSGWGSASQLAPSSSKPS
jgi:type VI secretion system secreted protein VgrG